MKRLFLLAFVCLLSVVSLWGQTNTSGSLTQSGSSCTSTAICVTLPLDPQAGAAAVSVTGTWSATLQFEGSSDGGNSFVAISGYPLNSTTGASNTTSNGTWRFAVSGLTHIRVRCSAYSSGTAAVVINSSLTAASISNGAGGGGSGTVTDFSAGNLSPLFTSSVATSSSTPALTFALSNASANTLFGNTSGVSGAPSFVAAPSGGTSGCSGATDTVIYTAGTGWGCHQITGSGTVNSGTQYQLGYYAANGTAVSGNTGITTDASNNLNVSGSIVVSGSPALTGTEGAAPSPPSAGSDTLYVETTNGFASINSSGTKKYLGQVKAVVANNFLTGFDATGAFSAAQPSTGNLSDWTNSGVANGNVPVWNSSTSKWTPGSAGGSVGPGTTGYLPLFATATTVGDSHVDDSITTSGVITSTEPVAAPSFTVSGNPAADGWASIADPAITTVASLGTPTAGVNKIVTDGANSTDCVSGGGTTKNWCQGNGTGWVFKLSATNAVWLSATTTPNAWSYYNGSAIKRILTDESAIALANLATQAADTVVANATAGSASPTAVSLPSCANDGGHALVYTGHAFACATITSGGASFASGGVWVPFGNCAYCLTSSAFGANGVYVFKITPPMSGTPSTISVHLNTSAVYKVGLYNSTCTTLLGTGTASGTVTGVQDLAFPAVSLTAGTSYYVAITSSTSWTLFVNGTSDGAFWLLDNTIGIAANPSTGSGSSVAFPAACGSLSAADAPQMKVNY